MLQCLFVGIGGFFGAISRYLINLIPLNSTFPLLTLLVNFTGALIMGFLLELSLQGNINKELSIMMKTGFCGGFTTFSTFSAETVGLFRSGEYGESIFYAIFSICACAAGIVLGKFVANFAVK